MSLRVQIPLSAPFKEGKSNWRLTLFAKQVEHESVCGSIPLPSAI